MLVRYTLMALVATALFALAGCSQDTEPAGEQPPEATEPAYDPDEVLARVEDETITRGEFESGLEELGKLALFDATGTVDSDTSKLAFSEEQKANLLANLIDARVEKILVERAGIIVTDEEVEDDIQLWKDSLPMGVPFEDVLGFHGLTMDELRERTRQKLEFKKFEEKQAADVEITEEAVRAFYDELLESGAIDLEERVDMAHIMVAVPADTPENWEAARERLDEALVALEAGRIFAEVARQYSDDISTKSMGGVRYGVTRRSAEKAFTDKAFATTVGEISEPFKTSRGWHVVKILAKHEAGVKPLSEIEEDIRTTLRQDRKAAILSGLIDEAKAQMDIEIMEGAPVLEDGPGPLEADETE